MLVIPAVMAVTFWCLIVPTKKDAKKKEDDVQITDVASPINETENEIKLTIREKLRALKVIFFAFF